MRKTAACICCLALLIALGGWLAGAASAQQTSTSDQSKSAASSTDQSTPAEPTGPPSGIDVGNYNIQSSIEAGGRYSNVTGSAANYDTFVNLQPGARLLDFSLGMRSLNHNGSLFDNLSLTAFGLGGDPDDVVRLRMSKDKWYNFDATYRRDKYFFGYNLLANPENAATATGVVVDVNSALHLLDYSRGMGDFKLTLLPQSRVHIRLGYNRILEEGPSYSTVGAADGDVNEPGTATYFTQDYKTSTDIYNAGVDFNFLPRTILSFDEFVQHYKQDLAGANQNFAYQLSNGVPVDLGVEDISASASCNPATRNTDLCNNFLTYTEAGRPRSTMPTERFTFQTGYFRNLTMTGQFSYSSGSQTDVVSQDWAGYASRTGAYGTTDGGVTKAERVLVNGDWAAVYQVTNKFSVEDTFNYNAFRIPGYYDIGATNLYTQATHTGVPLAPGATPNTTGCPPPYTAATCPQHSSSSTADVADGTYSQFLKQDLTMNTFLLRYDFTPRFGAHLGFRYQKREVYNFEGLFYSQEIYYPGGATATAANSYLAARGDCATPANCKPGSGSLAGAEIFSGPATGNNTQDILQADIDGYSGLFGLWTRPTKSFRANFDTELFSADESAITRITPRQLQRYTGHATYTPTGWFQTDANFSFLENRDNVFQVQDVEHNQNYAFSATLTPKPGLSFDLNYNHSDIYTQAIDCFVGTTAPFGANSCPIPASITLGDTLGALSVYKATTYFAGGDIMWRPREQVTVTAGYAGTFARGTAAYESLTGPGSVPFLNANTPYGPLRFNYHLPYATLTWNVTRGFSYRAAWNYYGYDERSPLNPATLAPLPTENFNGNNMTLSAIYTF